jgi:hypothetical protein
MKTCGEPVEARTERQSIGKTDRIEVEVLGGDGCRLRGRLGRARRAVLERVRMTDPATYLRVAVLVPKELNVAVEQTALGG